MYNDLYGLSCVENQTLSFIRKCGVNENILYHDSAVPISILYNTVIKEGLKYEDFDLIPRVQNILKKSDIISMKLINQSIDCLFADIKSLGKNQIILIKISPEFTKNHLFSRGWREDHFVKVHRISDYEFELFNDIPATIKTLSADQLASIFQDEYFYIKLLRKITDEDENRLWKERIYKPEIYEPFLLTRELIYSDMDETKTTEDVLKQRICTLALLIKTLKKRMFMYYNRYADFSFLEKTLIEIEKGHTILEYYKLKKSVGLEYFIKKIIEINEYDNYYCEQIGNVIKEGDK